MTLKEIESDFSVSVQESLEEAWVDTGLLWGRGTESNSPDISPFEGGPHYCHYPYQSFALGQPTGREYSPTHQQKIGLKIY